MVCDDCLPGGFDAFCPKDRNEALSSMIICDHYENAVPRQCFPGVCFLKNIIILKKSFKLLFKMKMCFGWLI